MTRERSSQSPSTRPLAGPTKGKTLAGPRRAALTAVARGKHSVESLTSTVRNGSSKPVADSKEERRNSIGSPTPLSRNDSIKSENDMRDERICGGMLSPLGDSSSPPSCFMLSCYQTGDSVRDKCVEMITAALKTDDDFKQFGTNCDRLAFEIEESIYNEMKVTDMKYRNRVRSRISNLKDPKNPNLRRNVLCGVVTPQRIAIMTAEEMASDELRELRNTLTQEAIREHQMAKTGGTQTDLLQCDKCKKKNCTYNQVQTRSADEPMTTFVLCNECGNRWKVKEPIVCYPVILLSTIYFISFLLWLVPSVCLAFNLMFISGSQYIQIILLLFDKKCYPPFPTLFCLHTIF
ncbi:transcription elongation factor XSII-K1 [Pelobates cultripes]|uniref:Transcription elongation factor n=1 Tax=Pelobates cultripes TaxID=61616 RepID=A0AAD1R0Z9_PELCU|nr:transcription elongation factor XSII-K1 [Pelobates cultripes]